MRDVREQLLELMRHGADGDSYEDLADAILERFDVVEKPVITSEALGKIVRDITKWDVDSLADIGERLLGQLDGAGLRIVKVDTE